jgi:hypothetical protein
MLSVSTVTCFQSTDLLIYIYIYIWFSYCHSEPNPPVVKLCLCRIAVCLGSLNEISPKIRSGECLSVYVLEVAAKKKRLFQRDVAL